MGQEATAPAAAPPSGSLTPVRLLLGLGVLLGLNHAMTDLMDESGLPVLMVTAQLALPSRNATAEALFETDASALATAWVAGDRTLHRLDVLEVRTVDAASPPTYAFVQVRARGGDDNDALPAGLTSALRVQSSVKLLTVFPERTRWRQAVWLPNPKEGELAQLGSLALLVEQTSYTVTDADADAFARAWSDLGYNSLGEAGVLRCDLMREAARPSVFVARKVFRSREAAREHEASEHLAQWREQVRSFVTSQKPVQLQLDTVHPRSSPFPFRSGWTTV